MAFDYEWYDTGDLYGPDGYSPTLGVELSGRWNTQTLSGLAASARLYVTTSLVGPGCALAVGVHKVNSNPYTSRLQKTLPATYARIIGGIQIKGNGTTETVGVTFFNGVNTQCSLTVDATTGVISFRRGFISDTIIASSAETITSGANGNIEWDVTFHDSTGIVKVWLNGVLTTLNLTGQDTQAAAASGCNGFSVGILTTAASGADRDVVFQHLYLRCFVAAGGSETPLGVAMVELSPMTADDAAMFAFGADLLGADYITTTTSVAPGANSLILRQYTPDASGTLDAVWVLPRTTSASAKFKAVAYADSAGAPGALLATGTEVTGCTSGTLLQLPGLAQAVTGGSPIWIGLIFDTAINFNRVAGATPGYRKANTYASGPPNPAGSMTSGQPDWLLFGVITGVSGANWAALNQNPPSTKAYNSSNNVGDQDTFSVASLYNTPSAIHSVATLAYVAKTDAGARTMDLLMKSGATTGVGDASGLAVPSAGGWLTSHHAVDPSTGSAWAPSALASAKPGYKIAA